MNTLAEAAEFIQNAYRDPEEGWHFADYGLAIDVHLVPNELVRADIRSATAEVAYASIWVDMKGDAYIKFVAPGMMPLDVSTNLLAILTESNLLAQRVQDFCRE